MEQNSKDINKEELCNDTDGIQDWGSFITPPDPSEDLYESMIEQFMESEIDSKNAPTKKRCKMMDAEPFVPSCPETFHKSMMRACDLRVQRFEILKELMEKKHKGQCTNALKQQYQELVAEEQRVQSLLSQSQRPSPPVSMISSPSSSSPAHSLSAPSSPSRMVVSPIRVPPASPSKPFSVPPPTPCSSGTLVVPSINYPSSAPSSPIPISPSSPCTPSLSSTVQHLISSSAPASIPSAPTPPLAPQNPPKSSKSGCPCGQTPCVCCSSGSLTVPPSPSPVEPNSPSTACNLQSVWQGKLSLEKGPSKEIAVTAYAPNVCSSSIVPLFAQFEGQASNSVANWPSTLSICGVCASTNLNWYKKYSTRMLLLLPDCQPPGNVDTYRTLLHQLAKNTWVGVVNLPEHTILLVPFRQEKLLGIVLTKMPIALSTTSMEQDSVEDQQAHEISQKYHTEGELKFYDKMVDGFFDGGRADFCSLQEYKKQPPNQQPREVLLVDSTQDKKLASYVRRAEEMLNRFADVESQARVLALFVSNCFGGDFPNTTAISAEILRLKQAKKSNVLLIGEITNGVCRHRAILYKYLCDRLGIECELKRGNYTSSYNITGTHFKMFGDFVLTVATGAHAWNVIKLGMQYYVVDIMHEPTQLYSIDSEKANSYTQVGSSNTPKDTQPSDPPILKLQLSSRRFIRLPNLREKAVFHEKLGRGGYGSVYRITLGGLACALKKIDIGNMKDQQKQYALQEVQVMETLQHENIIHYLGHELLEDKNELHILMELFPISLGQLIEKRRKTCSKFCSSEIKHIAIEILNGIDYLHNQNPAIIHRDLKPDNILIDVDEYGKINKVKITDFGVCKILSGTRCGGDSYRVGTELYMAPEILSNNSTSSPKTDIWSFGMVLVELFTLNAPYYGMSAEAAMNCIKLGQPPLLQLRSDLSTCEKRIVDIIHACLQLDPAKRPAAEQLVISFFRLQCPNQ